jgi:hypothetical protein
MGFVASLHCYGMSAQRHGFIAVDSASMLPQRRVCQLALKLQGFCCRGCVVCSGAGVSGVGAACDDHLAVVWAQGPPEPLNNTQQLAYTVRRAHWSSHTLYSSPIV